MKKLIKRIFRGKYYKNGESYVDTIVKVIICVVVGALLLTSVYAVAKSGLESAKNKVNDLLDYNPDGEDGPGGGDISIPGGGDESEPEVPDLPQLAAPLIDIEGDTLSIIDEEGDADEFELYIDGEYTQDINAEPTTVFDLSVLSLEDGSHTIQCKAKAEGYQTSEFSNSVEYEVVAPSGYSVTVYNSGARAVEIYDGEYPTYTLIDTLAGGNNGTYTLTNPSTIVGTGYVAYGVDWSCTGGVTTENGSSGNAGIQDIYLIITADGTITVEYYDDD